MAEQQTSNEQSSNDLDRRALDLYREVTRDLKERGETKRLDQLEEYLAGGVSQPVAAALANLLTHCHFQAGRFQDALAACTQWIELAPEDVGARNSRLSILTRLGRFEELVTEAEGRLDAEPENTALRSSLCNALGQLGRLEEARALGGEILKLRDAESEESDPVATQATVPEFDPARRERNIISFSLFGSKAKYLQGAVRNAVAAKFIYPEWTCRFYVDESVPEPTAERLRAEGAQVMEVSGIPSGRFGTFWRFLVAEDPEVDRFLVRDVDACLNLRERAAVEEWLESGRRFHVMRDAIAHTELILAGMWGGTGGVFTEMGKDFIRFCEDAPLSRTADQQFLRQCVWPTVRGDVLVHDSQFSFGDSHPFPARADIPGLAVGQAVPFTPTRGKSAG